ncbi:MAG: hypothetical protein WAP98_06870 [Caldicoprobacterales bacterium]|jgi:hypothetical protein|nr:hypothetical protein [Clostridia bacterium]MDI9512493.1 hypothetical protein [Bacillota bacterium]NLH57961.1 hypothetical protein [Clostridiales bacterium]
MNYPDLLGIELKKAKEILTNKGASIKYNILYYESPKRKTNEAQEEGEYRVIRQRFKDNQLELTVSFFKKIN